MRTFETLYVAVTGDEYELPLYVTETVEEMATWAGIKASSVRSMVCRNKNKAPFHYGSHKCKFRIRKIIMEDDENDPT